MDFKRVVIKLSGEMLAQSSENTIELNDLLFMADNIKKAQEVGTEIAIVIGGGNIMRGSSTNFLTRVTADQIGMLGTVINALALSEILKNKLNVPNTVLGAFNIPGMISETSSTLIEEAFNKKHIIIFAGGIGLPFFSTDMTGVLKALEIKADILIKATKVDGVYTQDPLTYCDASKIDSISYAEILEKKLAIMDLTAVSLAMEHQLPIGIIKLSSESLINVINKKNTGTLVS